MSSFGLNQICAGDHLALSATGANGAYTWSPTVGLSATTGTSVVVGPLTTTAYTVTSTNLSTGAATTATLNVNVLENCCPQTHSAGLIIAEARCFDAGTGSPFIDAGTGRPYPIGTRFHFTDSSPIVLSGLAFQPPVGSVILYGWGQGFVTGRWRRFGASGGQQHRRLQDWAAGVYIVTLYVDGTAAKATKLFVP